MVSLTEMERKALLLLVKDYTTFYNAHSLSNKITISPVGSHKLLKRLQEAGLTRTKVIGKSVVHKIKLDDDYVRKLIMFLLADEANNYKRWKEEFKDLDGEGRMIVLFGSAVTNYERAKDIDIMIIMRKDEHEKVNGWLRGIEELLPKKLHAIKLTKSDLLRNMENENEVIKDIIRNGVVLYGQEEYVEVLRHVAGF